MMMMVVVVTVVAMVAVVVVFTDLESFTYGMGDDGCNGSSS